MFGGGGGGVVRVSRQLRKEVFYSTSFDSFGEAQLQIKKRARKSPFRTVAVVVAQWRRNPGAAFELVRGRIYEKNPRNGFACNIVGLLLASEVFGSIKSLDGRARNQLSLKYENKECISYISHFDTLQPARNNFFLHI
jgi:hypothetical protein